ncbi:MAG: ZIP family metal transporter [Thermoproteus sp.]
MRSAIARRARLLLAIAPLALGASAWAQQGAEPATYWALAPIALGLLAGITVLIGTFLTYRARSRASGSTLGVLQASAGGILAYLALETGHAAEEYVEDLASWSTLSDFAVAAVATTAAFLGTFFALTAAERASLRRGARQSLTTAFVISTALGVHNVGEGFAIAASLLSGAPALAVLFAVGFAVHNATEGFAITGPLLADRGVSATPSTLASLSLLAGLPTVLGSGAYYLGLQSALALAVLNAVANASIVYAMLHVNLNALSRLGGVSSPKFWAALTAGVALAFTTESILMLAGLNA